MLAIVRSNRFLKDLRLAKKRGLDLSPLQEVVEKLAIIQIFVSATLNRIGY